MAYTPTTWTTGDTITASALNKIEQGIADGGGGSPWDAVVRLVHANNSGQDTPANLSISIVSGSYADLYAKIQNGGYPCILVEYKHLMFGQAFSLPMAYITYVSPYVITFVISGMSTVTWDFTNYGIARWSNEDSIILDD